ncbi:MAG: hypothetical protein AAGA54_09585 [Myxococcota bacterium]
MKLTWLMVAAFGLCACGPAVDTNESEGGSESSGGDTGSTDPSGGSMPQPEPEPETGSTPEPATSTTTMTPEPGSSVTSGGGFDDSGDSGGIDVPQSRSFLIAITATPVSPETPFQFLGEVTTDGFVATFSLTPLTLDVGSTDTPRDPLPPPLVFENIAVDDDGVFAFDAPEVLLPGAANPITGSDIVADLTIEAQFQGEKICGRLGGEIVVPIQLDLAGSTFSGVALLDDGPLPPVSEAQCQ